MTLKKASVTDIMNLYIYPNELYHILHNRVNSLKNYICRSELVIFYFDWFVYDTKS